MLRPISAGLCALIVLASGTAAQTAKRKPAKSAKSSEVLPLKHGFYVDAGAPCGEASNAVIALYEGKSLMPSRGRICQVQSSKINATTYRIKTACGTMGQDGYIDSDDTVSIASPTKYELIVNNNRIPYRYCAIAEMPERFRNTIIK